MKKKTEKVAKKLQGLKTYKVVLSVSGWIETPVEARSEEDAMDKVWGEEKDWDSLEITDMSILEIERIA